MDAAVVSRSRAYITLALVVCVYALSYIDRQVFAAFMTDIKADLSLNDTELGLLAGTTFSIFYLLAAFPIARYSDRGDRRLVIALCVSVWSLAAAACGTAANGIQMAFYRIGLAAGEGGAGPAGQSLLLHLFPKHQRTLVLSCLLAASSIGLGSGLVISGFLSQSYDWRQSMIIVGLPGLLVGLAVWLFAAEPRRKAGSVLVPPPQVPLAEVFRSLGRSPSLRWVALTIVSVSMTGFPFIIWSSHFYQTVHHMTVKESGEALFIPITGGLVAGNLLAGWLGDRFGKGDPRFYGRLASAGLVAAFPFGLAVALLPDARASLACFFIFHVLITIHLAPMQALAFAQVPIAMRAMLGATINMIITLCGIGIGTFMVGALSDIYVARFGELSLRYALLTVCFSMLVGAASAIMAARSAKLLPGEG